MMAYTSCPAALVFAGSSPPLPEDNVFQNSSKGMVNIPLIDTMIFVVLPVEG